VASDLKPEPQSVIDLAVQSGAYQHPEEVLEQAFELSESNFSSKTG
jgi:hypothetical protein